MRLETKHLMVPELLVPMVPMAWPMLLIKKHRLLGTNNSGTIRRIVSRRISKCSELKTLSICTDFVQNIFLLGFNLYAVSRLLKSTPNLKVFLLILTDGNTSAAPNVPA